MLNLYSNCIKLASENKINAKNTWSLALIDHISEIVRDSKDEDGQTNFQKSSCTLDAGVKIYASRVDSFHNETFKMLGGMNKVTQSEECEDEDGAGAKGDGADGSDAMDDGADGGKPKRRSARAVATLEQPDAHTVKEVATATVDPLFQKTSALFDEGGASGLLLCNLSVHRGCNICFDSEEVPCYEDVGCDDDERALDGVFVDLSSMRPAIDAARKVASTTNRITPSIAVIEETLAELVGGVAPSAAAAAAAAAVDPNSSAPVSLFDFSSGEGLQFAEYDDDDDDDDDDETGYDNADANEFGGGFDDDAPFGMGENWNDDHGGGGGGGGGGAANDSDALDEEGGAGLEWVVNSGVGGKMAWAGPSHWRFKAPSKPSTSNGDGGTSGEKSADGEDGDGKPKKKKGELTYDFENLEEPDETRFTLSATGEELLLVTAPTATDTLLPPDLGYEASDLIKLSLRPNFGIAGASSGGAVGVSGGGGGGGGDFFGGDDGDFGSGGFAEYDDDDENNLDDAAPSPIIGANGDLVDAPRRVEKIRVNYDRSSKQVDVKELKSTLWDNIHDADAGEADADAVEGTKSFHDLLDKFPEDNAAGATEDISVHMAFICLLHLANEHGLKITDRETLNDLDISGKIPAA